MESVAASIKIERNGSMRVVEWFDTETEAVEDAAVRNASADQNTAYRAVRSTRFGMFESIIEGEGLYL